MLLPQNDRDEDISAQIFHKGECETWANYLCIERVWELWQFVHVSRERDIPCEWLLLCCSVELGINVLFKFCILQTWDRNQNYYDIRPEHRTATGIPDRQLLLRSLQSRIEEKIILHLKRYLLKNLIMCPADYIMYLKYYTNPVPSWQIFFKLLRKSSSFPYL